MVLFGGTIFFDFVVLIITCFFAFYAYVIRKRNKWLEKGIPDVVESNLFLGHLRDVLLKRKIMGQYIKEFYFKTKNKPYVSFYAFDKPHVMVNDMELVKNILIKDFHFFADRHIDVSKKNPLGYYNMFVAKGQLWRQLRTKLSPTFTSGKLKRMFPLIGACGKEFVNHVEREKNLNGEIEIKEAAARFTSDVIQSTAFGLEGDSLVNNESAFRNIMKQVFVPRFIAVVLNLAGFLYPALMKLFLIIPRSDTAGAFCRKTVWSTVEYREKNNVKRNDFLDLLIELRKKGHIDGEEGDEDYSPPEEEKSAAATTMKKDYVIDGDIFVAQCYVFMLAGFETSSTLMSWALYEMSLNLNIQERVFNEITDVLEKYDGNITYEAVQEMSYLNMVQYETLRKYPSSVFIDRQAMAPYKLPGTNITLDKGQGVLIPAIGIHYDPDFYPDPERFDPERFSPENSQSRPPCSFLGFGEGPRICIGMRLGLLQAKVGLVYLIKNYSFVPCEKTPIPVVYDKNSFLQSPKGGMVLRLQKRN